METRNTGIFRVRMGRKGQLSFDLIFAVLLLLLVFSFFIDNINTANEHASSTQSMVVLRTLATDIAAQMEAAFVNHYHGDPVVARIEMPQNILGADPLPDNSYYMTIEYKYGYTQACVKNTIDGAFFCSYTRLPCWSPGQLPSNDPALITINPSQTLRVDISKQRADAGGLLSICTVT